MTLIGRRLFCTALGAGIAGLSGVLSAGCSSTGGNATSVPSEPGSAFGGLSLQVRRDPG